LDAARLAYVVTAAQRHDRHAAADFIRDKLHGMEWTSSDGNRFTRGDDDRQLTIHIQEHRSHDSLLTVLLEWPLVLPNRERMVGTLPINIETGAGGPVVVGDAVRRCLERCLEVWLMVQTRTGLADFTEAQKIVSGAN
jgi:hypothetical protein